MHRALYWGHLRAAALLLEAGAQLSVLDHQVRSLEAILGGVPGSCMACASGKRKKGFGAVLVLCAKRQSCLCSTKACTTRFVMAVLWVV